MIRMFYRQTRLFSKILQTNICKVVTVPEVSSLSEAKPPDINNFISSLGVIEDFDRLSKSLKTFDELKENDESYISIIQKLQDCTFDELNFYSAWYGKKIRISKLSEELHDKIWEATENLFEKRGLSVAELNQIAQNVLKNPKNPIKLNRIVDRYIFDRKLYLNFEEILCLIDLNFNMNKSLNLNTLNHALSILDMRVSQTYNGKKLLNAVEILSNIIEISDKPSLIIKKLINILHFKVELPDPEDFIKVFEIYYKCEKTHKTLLTLTFKRLNMIYKESQQGLPIEYLISLINSIAEIAKRRSAYISHFIRSSLLNDIKNKITLECLKSESYGTLLQNIITIESSVPRSVIDLFKKKLKNAEIIDYSYVLCYNMLKFIDSLDEMADIEMLPIVNVNDLSIFEVLKLNHAFWFSKLDKYPNVFSKLKVKCIDRLNTYVSDNNLDNVVELMKAVESFHSFKFPITKLHACMNTCLTTLSKRKDELSFYWYISEILKTYSYGPVNAKIELLKIAETHPEDQSLEILKSHNPFPLTAISFLFEAYRHKIKETNIVSVFAFINEDSQKSEVINLAEYINRISGKLFENTNLQYFYFKFYFYIQTNKLEFFFEKFLKSQLEYLESLDDSALSSPIIFKLARHLAISRFMTKPLATKILNIHISFFIKDHLSFLYLFNYHEDPEVFYQMLLKRVLPEFTSGWTDAKDLTQRIMAYSYISIRNAQIDKWFEEILVDKIRKWHTLAIDEILYVLENLHEGEQNRNIKVIHDYLYNCGLRIRKESFGLGTIHSIKALKGFCSFTYKDNEIFQTLFSDIGRLYSKFSNVQKIEILVALGNRGLCNQEVFKIVCEDLIKKKRLDHEIYKIVDALTAICDANLEAKDFAKQIESEVLEILNKEDKILSENISTKIGYCLAKLNNHEALKVLSFKTIKLENMLFYLPKKRLILYHYCNSHEIEFGLKSEQMFLEQTVDNFSLWGYRKDTLEDFVNNMKNKNIKPVVYGKITGFRVPLAFPKFNAAVIPKNSFISTYDGTDLKGDYNLLINSMKKQGANVYIIDSLNELLLEDATKKSSMAAKF